MGSVRDLLTGNLQYANFDLVYAAGLFDYLTEKVARALVARMVTFLKRGGTLLIANFASGLTDAGYMEAFMDWRLTYRTRDQMRSLLSRHEKFSADGATAIHTDEWGAITYLVSRAVPRAIVSAACSSFKPASTSLQGGGRA